VTPDLRNRHPGNRELPAILAIMAILAMTWLALFGGMAAAGAALYGYYRVLPAWLTGPEICRLEAGGCAVLFRSPRAALLGIPNASLGLLLYVLLAAGLVLDWPAWLLFLMTLPAVAMSAFLGWSLIVNQRQCRICWTGHASNAVLFLMLGVRAYLDR
jgi:uncharacterized membrane protein